LSIKLFRDPIHGYIEVSDCAREIINSPFFQRLRRIKQLSFTNLVYHGAEHSRFGHSLGTYHLAKKISQNLLSNKDKKIKEEFCLAALLHDIGHHPFSHSFESVLKNVYQLSDIEVDHEKYTLEIIDKTDIAKYIKKHKLNKNNVMHLIKGSYTEKPKLQYLNHLISSEFDIDRLDYLLRDCYYCGVPYGNIDLERLLYSLEPEVDKIIISEKGLHSAEMYVMSRFYMYTQVYLHHTTRAFDLMLNKIFSKEVFDEIEYPLLEKNSENDSLINNFINYDDSWLIDTLKRFSDKNSFKFKILAKQIIKREPIKCIVEKYDLTQIDRESADKEYTTISNLRYDIERLAKKAQIDEDYIFFDEPWKDLPMDSSLRPYIASIEPKLNENEKTENKRPILIRTRKGLTDIASIQSSIAYSISRLEARVIRIYTLEKYRKKLGEAIEKFRPNIKHLVWKDKIN